MQRPLHVLRAVLLAGTVPLFLGVLLSDVAYSTSYELQWKNFASWLLVEGLVFGGVALLWALIDLARAAQRELRQRRNFFLLLAMWILGFIDALVHAKDAWASMPAALVLSVIVALLALAATWAGLASSRVELAK